MRNRHHCTPSPQCLTTLPHLHIVHALKTQVPVKAACKGGGAAKACRAVGTSFCADAAPPLPGLDPCSRASKKDMTGPLPGVCPARASAAGAAPNQAFGGTAMSSAPTQSRRLDSCVSRDDTVKINEAAALFSPFLQRRAAQAVKTTRRPSAPKLRGCQSWNWRQCTRKPVVQRGQWRSELQQNLHGSSALPSVLPAAKGRKRNRGQCMNSCCMRQCQSHFYKTDTSYSYLQLFSSTRRPLAPGTTHTPLPCLKHPLLVCIWP